MPKTVATALAFSAALLAQPSLAQDRRQNTQASSPTLNYLTQVPAEQQPDVLLDIPNLSVESITLEVQGLEAHVSLNAQLANLLKLNAGADVERESVKLDIKSSSTSNQARHQRGTGPGRAGGEARQRPCDHRAHAADARQQPADRHSVALNGR